MICFTYLMLAPATAHADTVSPRPILYTYYRQMGWGDRVEIGYVDSNGDLWKLEGNDLELEWPFNAEQQLQYLRKHEFEKTGTLEFDDLFDLKSLVASVQEFDGSPTAAANDAGTERTYAVRYDREGNSESVLLGMSGDDMFENRDSNAQGLYLAAHKLFPHVTCYGPPMGPTGFIPVRITDFCGLGDLSGCTVTATFIDCEAGPKQITLTDEKQAELLNDLLNRVVTGKVSAVDTTGGYRIYYFYRGDDCLGSISVYNGLLYLSDGMYATEREA